MRASNLNAFMRMLALLLLLLCFTCIESAPLSDTVQQYRKRRQIDLTVSADHNDRDKETELALEAIAGLWESKDKRTQIDGSAKVVHRSNSLQTGPNDWRLGLRVVFN